MTFTNVTPTKTQLMKRVDSLLSVNGMSTVDRSQRAKRIDWLLNGAVCETLTVWSISLLEGGDTMLVFEGHGRTFELALAALNAQMRVDYDELMGDLTPDEIANMGAFEEVVLTEDSTGNLIDTFSGELVAVVGRVDVRI